MFAAIRHYQTNPDSTDEVFRRIREGFVPVIKESPGFMAYFLLDAGQGEIGTVSVFEDQRSAEESNRKAEEWVKQNMAGLLSAPEFAAGEVIIYETK